jgi:CO/xanthine dehydrogenase Mo-binding subunit
MANSKNDAVENARNDLAKRLKIDAADVKERSVEEADFPDMALGAPEAGEMSGQMITRGWRIQLEAKGQTYEYRADKNQLRAYKFKGKNYRI